MCGIFGFSNRLENSREILKLMGEEMIHRGPDGDGYFIDENLSMGMRRLSILDIEKGNQPFYNNDKTVVVMCNGEIYNFLSLRKELESNGYSFITNCDIEVIPHLYEKFGIEFIEKLNGMFTIALYDIKNNQFYLIRDRLGIKPLYYKIKNDQLIYASELKSILVHPSKTSDIDYDSLSSYLDLMYIPTPGSPFKDIKKLESGSFLSWNKSGCSIEKYWELKPRIKKGKEEKYFLEQIEHILSDSIKLELISDVPVGSFLSGGLDSSIVTTMAASKTLDDFSVFHIRWKNIIGKLDESIYAESVVENFQIKKEFHDVKNINVIDLLPQLIWHLDEPFADGAFLPTYYLANIASENVKVIFSGAGGDENFGGYSHYRNYPIWKSVIKSLLNKKAHAFSYYDICRSGHEKHWKELFPWYCPDVSRETYDINFRNRFSSENINAIMLKDLQHYLQDDILFLTDKMTMAASIECRVPLLDHRLVEFSQTIPPDLKIKDGESKYIFKKFSEKYLTNDNIYRPKEGFGFPIEKWINKYKELYFDPLIKNGFLFQNDLINKRIFRKHYLLKTELSHSHAWIYWKIIIMEIWFQIFISKVSIDSIYDL